MYAARVPSADTLSCRALKSSGQPRRWTGRAARTVQPDRIHVLAAITIGDIQEGVAAPQAGLRSARPSATVSDVPPAADTT